FRVVPWATFTDPEAAHLGLTEGAARAAGIAYEVHRQPFTQDDRALVDGEGQGFVKILSSPGWSGKIIGVHILGPRAGELIQEWVIAMRYGLNIRQIADAIHVYPTLTIASQRAAQRWYEKRSNEPLVQTGRAVYRKVRPALPGIVQGLGVVVAAGLIVAASKVRRRK
ncbi:MAG: hypothetical protein M3Y56_15645, partial [Armatimonadota bacterium]|nr:hypothetical protein [Armatimonadota bacterium]